VHTRLHLIWLLSAWLPSKSRQFSSVCRHFAVWCPECYLRCIRNLVSARRDDSLRDARHWFANVVSMVCLRFSSRHSASSQVSRW
jgi:hypothetical protein